MKLLKPILGSLAITISLVACKENRKEIAQNNVDQYVSYVDSVKTVAVTTAAENWDEIQNDFDEKRNNLINATNALEEKKFQNEIDKASLAYERYKSEVMYEKERLAINQKRLNFQRALVGKSFTGNDMKFTWINKDNILSVYQNFVNTVSENKDSYSREDWDEIKLLYEAIDSRKNTVENEGLTGKDNRKIAALKLKFAPMYTFNRMGAKFEENSKAKL